MYIIKFYKFRIKYLQNGKSQERNFFLDIIDIINFCITYIYIYIMTCYISSNARKISLISILDYH